MHASWVIVTAALVLSAGSTHQDNVNNTSTTIKSNESSMNSCVTARNISGMCARREACDYGTSAIDLTLYAPHGYTKTCTSDEVCCPSQYLIQQTEEVTEPSNFEFDEDD